MIVGRINAGLNDHNTGYTPLTLSIEPEFRLANSSLVAAATYDFRVSMAIKTLGKGAGNSRRHRGKEVAPGIVLQEGATSGL